MEAENRKEVRKEPVIETTSSAAATNVKTTAEEATKILQDDQVRNVTLARQDDGVLCFFWKIISAAKTATNTEKAFMDEGI